MTGEQQSRFIFRLPARRVNDFLEPKFEQCRTREVQSIPQFLVAGSVYAFMPVSETVRTHNDQSGSSQKVGRALDRAAADSTKKFGFASTVNSG